MFTGAKRRSSAEFFTNSLRSSNRSLSMKLILMSVCTRPRRQRSRRKSALQFFARRNSHLPRGLVQTSSSRKSLSTEETFAVDLATLEQCEEKLEELFQDVMADLAQKESTREITKIFVKLKFNDFTRTTAERTGLAPTLGDFRSLLSEAFARTGKAVRLIGLGVRFAEVTPESAQLDLL